MKRKNGAPLLEVGHYLIADPGVCFGKLTFKGTRVPVQTVLTFLARGDTIDYVLTSWPRLTREAVEEAIHLAAVAWPHLMRKDIAPAIQRLAKELQARHPAKDQATHESTHPGRTA